ncbi:MAG: hypothetical protein RLZZ490_1896 [Cyanobacteriota bacterium]
MVWGFTRNQWSQIAAIQNKGWLKGLLPLMMIAISNWPIHTPAQSNLYNPIPLSPNQVITDRLSLQDIPTGEGGFARDYRIPLNAGDQVAIDVQSDEFDTIVMLIADDGSTVIANDDSTEGGTHSLAFARIQETGQYIVRVTTFAATGGGRFSLKVSRLRPAP